jgi:phosphomannomutase
VDTEAIRPEDVQLASQWAKEHQLDAIVSTDGDSDRPLISDEHGRWLRGDVAGILCARFLGADSVSTPVSCNTAVERCGWFGEVRRTRIGSPYVVAAMKEATARGARCVVGYEANGGFLLDSRVQLGERTLDPLPTRDAVIVMLGILAPAQARRQTISTLLGALPARYTASDRLENFPIARSRALLERFSSGEAPEQRRAIESVFGELCGVVSQLDHTDGLRITFLDGDIVHLRPSGNAPEFRCYTESATEERARSLNGSVLARLRELTT